MPEKSLPIEQLLTMLEAGPRRIVELTAGLTEAQLHASPSPGQWSANEVLAHLRSCADVWGNCMLTILGKDKPTIRAVNPRTWITSTNYLDQEFQSSLRAFTMQRAELLAILKTRKPKTWSRLATITGAGKPLERTVHFYAQRMATHERSHVKQIGRIASQMHKQP